MRKALIRNSISGIALLVLSTGLVFFSVSIFNKKLGSELYGLFATLTLIGNVNIFSNLGINATLLIFLSEKGKCRESDHNIIVAFAVTLLISILVCISGILFAPFIINEILNIPYIYYNSILYLYILLVISNSIAFTGQVFTAILDSMQKIYLTNFFQLIYNILYNVLIIVSILITSDLTYIGFGILLTTIVWMWILVYFALSNWGTLEFSGINFVFFNLLKKQISLGSKVYLSGLVFFFYEPLTKILLSHFLGIKEVGFFDIALKIRNQTWGLINKISQPLLPLISKLQDSVDLKKLVHDFEQKIFITILPVTAIALFITEPFISLWIGGDNVHIISMSAFFVTASYLVFSSTMIPQYIYLMSKGHAEKTIYIQLTNVASNLIILFFTFQYLGYYAFVFSYTGAILSSFLLMLYYQKNILNSLIFDSWNQFSRVGISFVLILITGILLSFLEFSSFFKLLIFPFVLGISTLAFYKFLRVIKVEDLDRYLGTSNKFYNFAKRIIT